VACENLALKITQNQNNRLIVFESFPKWSLEFPNASFMEIPKEWITETQNLIDLEKTWIRHETAFTVLHGETITQFLHENKNCIFLINNDDIEAIAFFIYSVIYRFYRQKYDMLRKGYAITDRTYFVLEEAQNSLDAKILSSKLFRRYRKLFSEMRNMGLHAILITQRLQDLSTYFRCRTSLAIGKISLDDWDLKLNRMLKPIGCGKQILKMPIGSFYFSCINDIVQFPEFTLNKPKEFKPNISEQTLPSYVTIEPQQETTIQKIKKFFNKPKQETYECVSCGSPIDKEEYERNNGYCESCIMEEEELEKW
jgi:hypothetical protein